MCYGRSLVNVWNSCRRSWPTCISLAQLATISDSIMLSMWPNAPDKRRMVNSVAGSLVAVESLYG